MNEEWPSIAFTDWERTCTALHLWTQIVGKYRLSHAPWLNHSWHATLSVTPRGLTTGLIPDRPQTTRVELDFVDHRVVAEAEDGSRSWFSLETMSVADFLDSCSELVRNVGGTFDIDGRPNEIPDATPFAEDVAPRPYDRDAVSDFHEALVRVHRVFDWFRTGFLGKQSPVHFFWGSFDLAVTRFSGRPAPPHPGGIPNLPDEVTLEAYSHEVSSAGFWPGMGVDEPMFYSYAYPEPDGFRDWPALPDAARYDDDLGEFLLPYAEVRKSREPAETLMEFLQSTYEAAAVRADWNRNALECDLGVPGVPRKVSD